jgi:glycine dehydrogenase
MQIALHTLLDESTASAEAMIMMFNARPRAAVKAGANKFFIDEDVFPQNIAVMETRSEPLDIQVVKGRFEEFIPDETYFGAFVQYPAASGQIRDYSDFTAKAHAAGILVGVAADC